MIVQPILDLSQILELVGKLDDATGESTPRERFRQFLSKNVLEIGQIRDYVEECLRNSGDQYNRALQDLINYLGDFLDFKVTYGRYQGVIGQVGFDGHWESPTGAHIVVEVKTTEVYSIPTSLLLGYIDKLIDSKKIPIRENAIGLYVVGRFDSGSQQLEKTIIAEKRADQLRIISVESLLSLAELTKQYSLDHKDVLSVIHPSGPMIDSVVSLMTRVVSQPSPNEVEETVANRDAKVNVERVVPVRLKRLPTQQTDAGTTYWLTPVKDDEKDTAEEIIRKLVGEEHIYALGDKAPGRKRLKKGDWICFHASGKGIIGHARVVTAPERKSHPEVHHPEKYPWIFAVDSEKLYLTEPVVIDATLRNSLDAFKGKDPNGPWAWFVQATHNVTKHDFDALVRI